MPEPTVTFTPKPFSEWTTTGQLGDDPEAGYADYLRAGYLTAGYHPEEFEPQIRQAHVDAVAARGEDSTKLYQSKPLDFDTALQGLTDEARSLPQWELVQSYLDDRSEDKLPAATEAANALTDALRRRKVAAGELPFAKVRKEGELQEGEDPYELIAGDMATQMANPLEALKASARFGGVRLSDAFEAAQLLAPAPGTNGKPRYVAERQDRTTLALSTIAETDPAVAEVLDAQALRQSGRLGTLAYNADRASSWVTEKLAQSGMMGEEAESGGEDQQARRLRVQALAEQDEDTLAATLQSSLEASGVLDPGDESRRDDVKAAAARLADERAMAQGYIPFDAEKLGNNIRLQPVGGPVIHPALYANDELFAQALAERPELKNSEKKHLEKSRQGFLAANFDRYDKVLSDSPDQAGAWTLAKQQGYAAKTPKHEILQEFVKDPDNYSALATRAGGIGASLVDSIGGAIAALPAWMGNEAATGYLLESQAKQSQRRALMEVFGDPAGIWQDVGEAIAPAIVDVGLTALLSAGATPLAGGAYLAAKRGAGMTLKGLGKAITSNILRTSDDISAEMVAKRLILQGLLKTKDAPVTDIIKGFNEIMDHTVTQALGRGIAAGLPAANRAGGATYATLYSAMPDDLTHEQKHDRALGGALTSAAVNFLGTGAFSAIGRGGLEDAFTKGASYRQLKDLYASIANRKLSDATFNEVLKKQVAAGLSTVRKGLLKNTALGVADEFLEEGSIEFVDSFVEDAALNQDTPMVERWKRAGHAALVGGILGGGVEAVKLGGDYARSAVAPNAPMSRATRNTLRTVENQFINDLATKLKDTGSPLTAEAIRQNFARNRREVANMATRSQKYFDARQQFTADVFWEGAKNRVAEQPLLLESGGEIAEGQPVFVLKPNGQVRMQGTFAGKDEAGRNLVRRDGKVIATDSTVHPAPAPGAQQSTIVGYTSERIASKDIAAGTAVPRGAEFVDPANVVLPEGSSTPKKGKKGKTTPASLPFAPGEQITYAYTFTPPGASKPTTEQRTGIFNGLDENGMAIVLVPAPGNRSKPGAYRYDKQGRLVRNDVDEAARGWSPIEEIQKEPTVEEVIAAVEAADLAPVAEPTPVAEPPAQQPATPTVAELVKDGLPKGTSGRANQERVAIAAALGIEKTDSASIRNAVAEALGVSTEGKPAEVEARIAGVTEGAAILEAGPAEARINETIDSVLTEADKEMAAREMGEPGWSAGAAARFRSAFADWMVTGKTAFSKLVKLFKKVKNKVNAVVLAALSLVSPSVGPSIPPVPLSVIEATPTASAPAQIEGTRMERGVVSRTRVPTPVEVEGGVFPFPQGVGMAVASPDLSLPLASVDPVLLTVPLDPAKLPLGVTIPQIAPLQAVPLPEAEARVRMIAASAQDTRYSNLPRNIADTARWVMDTSDTKGRAFIVADKVKGEVYIFDGAGGVVLKTPALFGKTKGDSPLVDKATPSGRFEAAVDYTADTPDERGFTYGSTLDFLAQEDAVLAVHRTYMAIPGEARLDRLASTDPRDNRVSSGCINVADAVYDGVIEPLFGEHGGVVYVLPETAAGKKSFPEPLLRAPAMDLNAQIAQRYPNLSEDTRAKLAADAGNLYLWLLGRAPIGTTLEINPATDPDKGYAMAVNEAEGHTVRVDPVALYLNAMQVAQGLKSHEAPVLSKGFVNENLIYAHAEAVLAHEVGHLAGFDALTDEEVADMASKLKQADFERVISEYFPDDAGRKQALADLADDKTTNPNTGLTTAESTKRMLAEEWSRMWTERVTRGYSQEEWSNFLRGNPSRLRIAGKYLGGVFRAMANRLDFKRNYNPTLHAYLNRVSSEMRLLRAGYRLGMPVAGFDANNPAATLELMKMMLRNDNLRPEDLPGGMQGDVLRSPSPAFYSALERTVEAKLPARFNAQQAIATIEKADGVKAEELKWTGYRQLVERLASESKDGKINKADLTNALATEGRVEFEEVMLGGAAKTWTQADINRLERTAQRTGQWDEHERAVLEYEDQQLGSNANDTNNQTKFAQYQLPGGTNYREIVLAMPKRNAALKAEQMEAAKRGDYEAASRIQEQINKTGETAADSYTSTHFSDIPNYVAHMRVNERTDAEGQPGLFIEELQSDRHQQGREKGYKGEVKVTELPPTAKVVDRGDVGDSYRWQVQDGGVVTGVGNTREAAVRDALAQESHWRSQDAVTDAPFRKDWALQLFKRALRDAVASGKQWIGWTVGDTQNDRYDLSKQVDEIRADRRATGTDIVVFKDGSKVVERQDLTDPELVGLIGKDMAEKIANQTGLTHSYSGLDLKVGGSGMKGFYDTMLPKEIGRYVKQWGASVEKGSVLQRADGATWKVRYPNGRAGTVYTEEAAEEAAAEGAKVTPSESNLLPIWRVNITPAMRASVVSAGQPLFSPSSLRHAALEEKHNAGTITPEEVQEAGRLVEERANESLYRSKVRSDGRLTLLQHETPASFTVFKPGGDDVMRSGPAIWLGMADSSLKAGHRLGNRRNPNLKNMKLFADIKNPLMLDNEGMVEWARAAFMADKSEGMKREFPLLLPADVVTRIKAEGYDGIIFDTIEDRAEMQRRIYEHVKQMTRLGNSVSTEMKPFDKAEIIAFSANQLKSAEPFTGTPLDERFNPQSDSILRSPSSIADAARKAGYTGTGYRGGEKFEVADDRRPYVWLAEDPDYAAGYGKNPQKMFYRPGKVLDLTAGDPQDTIYRNSREALVAAFKAAGADISVDDLDIQKLGGGEPLWRAFSNDTGALKKKLVAQGFDSARIWETRGFEDGPPKVSVLIFNKNQIKSADEDTGVPLSQRFNPESDSILRAPVAGFEKLPDMVLTPLMEMPGGDPKAPGFRKPGSSFVNTWFGKFFGEKAATKLGQFTQGESDHRLLEYMKERDRFMTLGGSRMVDFAKNFDAGVKEIYGDGTPDWALIARAAGSDRVKAGGRATITDRDWLDEQDMLLAEALRDNDQNETIDEDERALNEEAIKQAHEAKLTARREWEWSKLEADRSMALAELAKLPGSATLVETLLTARTKVLAPLKQLITDPIGGEPDLDFSISNEGDIYITKAYKFFQLEGYAEMVKHHPEMEALRKGAAEYMEKSYVHQRTLNLIKEGKTRTEATRLAKDELLISNKGHTVSMGQHMLNQWLEEMGGASPQASNTKFDSNFMAVVNNLKTKADMPDPLAQVLGVYNDTETREKMLRTILVVHNMAANQVMLRQMRALGEKEGFMATKDVVTQARAKTPLAPTDPDFNPDVHYDPANFDPTKEGRTAYAGWDKWPNRKDNNDLFHDLFAPQEVITSMAAVNEAMTTSPNLNASEQATSALFRASRWLTGVSMGAKTLGSLGFYTRNIVSNAIFFPLIQGLTPLSGYAPGGLSGSASFYSLLGTEAKRQLLRRDSRSEQEIKEELEELTLLGIAGNEMATGIMRDLLKGTVTPKGLIAQVDALTDAPGIKVGKEGFKKLMELAKAASVAVDAFYKFAYYKHEVGVMFEARAAAATGDPLLGATDMELKKLAAAKVRMTAQTASETLPLIKSVERSAIGTLFAPFLRFKSEVPRILVNTWRLAQMEYKSGNEVLMRRGRQRIQGLIAASAISTLFPIVAAIAAGMWDEEEEAMRDSVPVYLRNNSFLFWRGKDGGWRSTDWTFVNPVAMFADPLARLLTGAFTGRPAEGGVDFAKALIFDQYLDDQILAGAVNNLRANEDPATGKPIWEANDSISGAFVKAATFLIGDAFAPMVGKKLVEGWSAIGGDHEGFLDSPAGIVLASMAPIKIHKVDLNQQYSRYLRERKEEYDRVRGQLGRLMSSKPMTEAAIIDLYDDVVKGTRAVNHDMLRKMRGMEGLGLSRNDIYKIMVDNGVSKNRVNLLRQGVMDRTILSPELRARMLAHSPITAARLKTVDAHIPKANARYIPLE